MSKYDSLNPDTRCMQTFISNNFEINKHITAHFSGCQCVSQKDFLTIQNTLKSNIETERGKLWSHNHHAGIFWTNSQLFNCVDLSGRCEVDVMLAWLVSQLIIIATAAQHQSRLSLGDPVWAEVLHLLVSLVPICFIPAWFFYYTCPRGLWAVREHCFIS